MPECQGDAVHNSHVAPQHGNSLPGDTHNHRLDGILSISDFFTEHLVGPKRPPYKRVFVNRDLDLRKIKFIGFDMDYTLAVYKSPEYEQLAFDIIKDKLASMGYPPEITKLEYDSARTVRGLWFDSEFGNLLKVDQFGNIRVCAHGTRFLKKAEVEDLYPNKFIELDENRVYVLNTLFQLPEAFMLANIIQILEESPETTDRSKTGLVYNNCEIRFKTVFQDVRLAQEWMHGSDAVLKKRTIENIKNYVLVDDRLPRLLRKLQSRGIKTFLLTNSDHHYTNTVMSYIIDEKEHDHWMTYFNCIVVNAHKPLFFKEGTALRQVDLSTGTLKLGRYRGAFQAGQMYSGGSVDVFTQEIGAKGRDVLYVGDHVYGDILKSKKTKGWRTFLIVPELLQELMVWTQPKTRAIFEELQAQDILLGELFRNLDADSEELPDSSHIQRRISELSRELDLQHGIWGSVFRTGQTMTFFSSQIMRYADLYGQTYLNLLYYPHTYLYKARQMMLAHESTVSHSSMDPRDLDEMKGSHEVGEMTRRKMERSQSLIPRVRNLVPPSLDEDEDSSDEGVAEKTKEMK